MNCKLLISCVIVKLNPYEILESIKTIVKIYKYTNI